MRVHAECILHEGTKNTHEFDSKSLVYVGVVNSNPIEIHEVFFLLLRLIQWNAVSDSIGALMLSNFFYFLCQNFQEDQTLILEEKTNHFRENIHYRMQMTVSLSCQLSGNAYTNERSSSRFCGNVKRIIIEMCVNYGLNTKTKAQKDGRDRKRERERVRNTRHQTNTLKFTQ